ncbi:MafI family immunity protein [Sphingobacterium sp. R2]|uniref:MafI family immunity protein n=1 Tax=Sphingobacterium sp. R2 TaxID=3112958 RepID=UPI00345D2D77
MGLNEADLHKAIEFLYYNKYGLCFETIITQLDENDLKITAPIYNNMLKYKFTIAEQVYQPITNNDIWGLINNAGFEAVKLKKQGFLGRISALFSISNASVGNEADFPLVLKDNLQFALKSKAGERAGRGFMEVKGLPFRISGSKILYNPSDSGQYIWGACMRANGYTYMQVWLVSNLNEWKNLGDSKGDQNAIKARYKAMDKWMTLK